jgi:hypothetical protein
LLLLLLLGLDLLQLLCDLLQCSQRGSSILTRLQLLHGCLQQLLLPLLRLLDCQDDRALRGLLLLHLWLLLCKHRLSLLLQLCLLPQLGLLLLLLLLLHELLLQLCLLLLLLLLSQLLLPEQLLLLLLLLKQGLLLLLLLGQLLLLVGLQQHQLWLLWCSVQALHCNAHHPSTHRHSSQATSTPKHLPGHGGNPLLLLCLCHGLHAPGLYRGQALGLMQGAQGCDAADRLGCH